VVPVLSHNPRVNLDTNRGSRSLMNLLGSPNLGNTCRIIKPAVSSAVMASLHGMNIAALLQLWSVMVSIESYPCDTGNLVIKSRVTVSKGIASGWGNMGCNGALVGHVLILFRWHFAHPFTYSMTSLHMFGHQYRQLISWFVLLIPRCPYTGESW